MIIIHDELGITEDKVVVTNFTGLFQYFPGDTKENQESHIQDMNHIRIVTNLKLIASAIFIPLSK